MIRLLVFLYIFGAVASDKESTTVTIGTPSTTLTNLSKVTLIISIPLCDMLLYEYNFYTWLDNFNVIFSSRI